MPEEIVEPAVDTPVVEETTTTTETVVEPNIAEGEPGEASAPAAPPAQDAPVEQTTTEGSTEEGNPFQSAFDGYSDEEVDGLLNLVAMLRDDPASAADVLAELATQLKGEESASGEGTGEQIEVPAGTPEDVKSQFEAWYAEKEAAREAEKQQVAAVEALDKRIDDLGYARGAEGEPAVDRAALLMLAHDSFGGDIDKAHEHIQAWIQSKVDAALAPKKAAKRGFAPLERNSGGGAEPGKGKVKSFEEAGKNLTNRLS